MKLCVEVKQIRMYTNYVKMVSDSISLVNEITIRHNPSEEEEEVSVTHAQNIKTHVYQSSCYNK